jgi:hypothetical protein
MQWFRIGFVAFLACAGCSGDESASGSGSGGAGSTSASNAATTSGSGGASSSGSTSQATTGSATTGSTSSGTSSATSSGAGGMSSNPALDKVCTPMTAVFQDMDPMGAGKIFTDHIPDPEAFIKEAAHRVCTILYHDASEVRDTPKVTLIIKSGPNMVADTGGSTTRFYQEYISGLSGMSDDAITAELKGVIHHEFTHIYQNFGGDFPVIEGMADFVRYRSGFIPDKNKHKGGTWMDGYQTTAFFFVYCDDTYMDFGYKLNQAAAKWPANNQAFKDITGKDVDMLWSDYQATF